MRLEGVQWPSSAAGWRWRGLDGLPHAARASRPAHRTDPAPCDAAAAWAGPEAAERRASGRRQVSGGARVRIPTGGLARGEAPGPPQDCRPPRPAGLLRGTLGGRRPESWGSLSAGRGGAVLQAAAAPATRLCCGGPSEAGPVRPERRRLCLGPLAGGRRRREEKAPPEAPTGKGASGVSRRGCRMAAGPALQEEYRRCLERDFRGGRVGACSDAALKELLWHQLLDDPELHCRLDGEATWATLATALRGQLDARGALRSLAGAFEVLELAAVNLYFFPWRKEFATIKTFSGVYVHVLQGVLPEADLARSFRRLGYVQQDRLHLVNSRLPPGANLLSAACCFFAARVECQILAKIVEELEPQMVPPDELLKARKEAKGSLERCVAKLQSLTRWPRSPEVRSELPGGLDLYRESAEGHSFYRESGGSRLWGQEASSLSECSSPRLLRRSPQPPAECRSEPPWSRESSCGNGLLGLEEPDLATSFSFISLRRELSKTSETGFPAQLGSSFLFSGLGGYESSDPPSQATSGPPSPPSRQPRSLRLSPASLHSSTQGLSPKPAHYQMHTCLLPGTLPCSCCNTCRLLHVGGCNGIQLCRNLHHLVEELQSEKQQRLWLQRTEVDRLLQEGGGGSWQ